MMKPSYTLLLKLMRLKFQMFTLQVISELYPTRLMKSLNTKKYFAVGSFSSRRKFKKKPQRKKNAGY